MSRDNSEEMRPEYDMRGAVRGKFLAHAQRWAGITTADGPIPVNALNSGALSTVDIVVMLDVGVEVIQGDSKGITLEVFSRSA